MQIELDSRSLFERYVAPRFDEMVHLNVDPAVGEEYVELMAKGGRPVLYGNHQGHGDGWLLGKVVEYLREKAKEAGVEFPGVVLPLARSMFTGDQGWVLKKITELSAPILQRRGLHMIPYTRNKDEINYGLKKNQAEVREMAKAAREGYGFCYLPEASIQGGRHKHFWGFFLGGEVNGVIAADDKDGFAGFYDLINRFGHVKGETFFMGVAMEGSYRFMGADIPIPTMELFQSLFADSSRPAQVTIESPITVARLKSELQEDWRADGHLLNKFLMRSVVKDLPLASRGIYRNMPDLEFAAKPAVLSSR
ncbi:MAG: hypothetical protein M1142_04530 [Patescibacteria group bacterium]|nr:hypothetical protein [Patescibacteria group bacterium]